MAKDVTPEIDAPEAEAPVVEAPVETPVVDAPKQLYFLPLYNRSVEATSLEEARTLAEQEEQVNG